MYHEFYGLEAEPFRLTPDRFFCFAHRSYAKAKRHMQYAVGCAEGFVMVTGKAGTGKTTLVQDLTDDLEAQKLKVTTLVSTQLGADELLRMVATSFGIDLKDEVSKATVLQRIAFFLAERHRNGYQTLLIVDEAQDLAASALEELRLLSNLQKTNQPLLQIFLLGQEGLLKIMRNPEMALLRQRIVATCHLDPLNSNETEGYVKHRLNHAGWDDDPRLSEKIYPIVHQFSNGIPRLINLICTRLLLHGSLEKKHQLAKQDALAVVNDLVNESLGPLAMPGNGYGADAEIVDHRVDRSGESDLRAVETDVLTPLPSIPVDQPSRAAPAAPAPPDFPAQKQLQPAEQPGRLAKGKRAGAQTMPPAPSANGEKAAKKSPAPASNLQSRPIPMLDDFFKAAPSNEPQTVITRAARYNQDKGSPKPRPEVVKKPSAPPPPRRQSHWGGEKLRYLGFGAFVAIILLAFYLIDPRGPEPHQNGIAAVVSSGDVNNKDAHKTSGIAPSSGGSGAPEKPTPSKPTTGLERMRLREKYQAEARHRRPLPERYSASLQVQSPQQTDQRKQKIQDVSQSRPSPSRGLPPRPVKPTSNEVAAINATTSTRSKAQTSTPPALKEPPKLILNNWISFGFDSTKIKPVFLPALDDLAKKLRRYKDINAHIVGYTSDSGPRAYNLDLSRRRATAVADYLMSRGVPETQLQIDGRGNQKPRAKHAKASSPRWDRLVEVYLESG